MTLFNIISCAIISAAIGRGYPRVLAVGAFIALLCLNQPTIGYFIAWLYAFTIIRLLPTGGLFQAIHGEKPKVDDGIICAITNDIYFAVKIINWKLWGIIYGFVRTLPILPAAYYLDAPLLYFMPFIGVIYYGCGKIFGGRTDDVLKDNTRAVIAAEIVVGAMVGGSL